MALSQTGISDATKDLRMSDTVPESVELHPAPSQPQPLPMPSDYFAKWWEHHIETMGEPGNVYSTRIAYTAVRAFVMEWRSMLIAQQMRGVPSDIAGMVAFKALSARLGF